MKKVFAILLSALLVLALAACDAEQESQSSSLSSTTSSSESSSEPESSSTESETSSETSEPSDSSETESSASEPADALVDCATMEEAAELAGFSLTLPTSMDEAGESSVQAVENTLISVTYPQEDASTICVRKGLTEADVFDSDTAYANQESAEVDGTVVTLYGDDDLVSLVVWEKDGYAYSLSFSVGVENSAATELIAEIQ